MRRWPPPIDGMKIVTLQMVESPSAAPYFFDLSQDDRREALEYAREQMGRPAHLLEKDV
jgi:hypothetical protein